LKEASELQSVNTCSKTPTYLS